jgi:hypothetical protein
MTLFSQMHVAHFLPEEYINFLIKQLKQQKIKFI